MARFLVTAVTVVTVVLIITFASWFLAYYHRTAYRHHPLGLAFDACYGVHPPRICAAYSGARQSPPQGSWFGPERYPTALRESGDGRVGRILVEVQVALVHPADERRCPLRHDVRPVLRLLPLPTEFRPILGMCPRLTVLDVDPSGREERP